MDKIKLGLSELNVSRICLGTMTFGSTLTKKESFEVMDTALDYGINYFDCAELYPAPLDEKHYGVTENIIGEWLKLRRYPDVIIESKCTGPEDAADFIIAPWVRGDQRRLDKKNILLGIEGTLKRLRRDYVDLYMGHWPDHSVNRMEQVSTFHDLINEGKIRTWGTSNEGPKNMPLLIEFCKENGFTLPAAQQFLYNLLFRHAEDDIIPLCLNENIALNPYSPLSMGLLTGKYRDGYEVDGSRFKYWPERYKFRFGNENARLAANKYEEIANDYDISVTHLSLAWLLAKNMTSIIIGVSKSEHVKDIVKCLDINLSENCMIAIDKIYKQVGNPTLGIS